MNYENYQNLMLLTSSDTRRTLHASILVYKFRPERTGFNIYLLYANKHLCKKYVELNNLNIKILVYPFV